MPDENDKDKEDEGKEKESHRERTLPFSEPFFTVDSNISDSKRIEGETKRLSSLPIPIVIHR